MLEKLFDEVKETLDFDVIEKTINKMSDKKRHAAITEFLLKKGIGIIGGPDEELTLGEKYFIGMLAGLHNHRVADIQEKINLEYFGAGCKNINFFVERAGDYSLFKAKNCLLQAPLNKTGQFGNFALNFAEKCTSIGNFKENALSNAKYCKAQGEFGNGALTRANSSYGQGNFGQNGFNHGKNLIIVADKIGSFYMPIESIVIFNSCGQIKSPPYNPRETLIMTTDPEARSKTLTYAGLAPFIPVSLEDVSKLDIFNNSFNSQIKKFLGDYKQQIPKWLEARK